MSKREKEKGLEGEDEGCELVEAHLIHPPPAVSLCQARAEQSVSAERESFPGAEQSKLASDEHESFLATRDVRDPRGLRGDRVRFAPVHALPKYEFCTHLICRPRLDWIYRWRVWPPIHANPALSKRSLSRTCFDTLVFLSIYVSGSRLEWNLN